MERVRVIDSHTGGEPTRVVVEGLPDLGPGSASERLARLKKDFDRYRTAIIGEPRSSPIAVGAYLLDSDVADYGVIFFNNVGYLGMCGHGTIGLVSTLAYQGRLAPGPVTFETTAGVVRAELLPDGRVSVENVPSYRYRQNVEVDALDIGTVRGDVAYGGNWFFISDSLATLVASNRRDELLAAATLLQSEIDRQGIAGANGARIDHIEFTGRSGIADAKDFVLCPGGEYDRSPCGTGTSAKLACLFEDGKLAEGQMVRVESIIGSVFEGSVRKEGERLIPTIIGRAYVNGESTLLIDANDPFAWGTPA